MLFFRFAFSKMFSLQSHRQIIITSIVISGLSIFENKNDVNDNPSILDKIVMDSSKYLILVESKNQGSKIHSKKYWSPFMPDLYPSPTIKESPAPRKPNPNNGINEVKKPEYDEDILEKGWYYFFSHKFNCSLFILFTFMYILQ